MYIELGENMGNGQEPGEGTMGLSKQNSYKSWVLNNGGERLH